jgi:plasmid stability protein
MAIVWLGCRIDRSVRNELHIRALREGKTLQALVSEILAAAVADRLPPPAAPEKQEGTP